MIIGEEFSMESLVSVLISDNGGDEREYLPHAAVRRFMIGYSRSDKSIERKTS